MCLYLCNGKTLFDIKKKKWRIFMSKLQCIYNLTKIKIDIFKMGIILCFRYKYSKKLKFNKIRQYHKTCTRISYKIRIETWSAYILSSSPCSVTHMHSHWPTMRGFCFLSQHFYPSPRKLSCYWHINQLFLHKI